MYGKTNFTISLSIWIVLLFTNGHAIDPTISNSCEIKWQNSKKMAFCESKNLIDLSVPFENDVQIINLSNNSLNYIEKRAFRKNLGLNDSLLMLILKSCNISMVHDDGFSDLSMLEELNLSVNRINVLSNGVFKNKAKLKTLHLNSNLLEELNSRIFGNLNSLQKLYLNDNRLLRISTSAFGDLFSLKTLSLSGNKLRNMNPLTISDLRNLSHLELHGNPWKCDCKLRYFRDLVVRLNISTSSTACFNRPWTEMKSTDFACLPSIIEPWEDRIRLSNNKQATLTCRATGDPLPKIDWYFNSTILDESSKDKKFIINESEDESTRWFNLTILSPLSEEGEDFTCVIKNSAGTENRTTSVAVIITKRRYLFFVFLSMIPIVSCCFCLFNRRKMKRQADDEEVNFTPFDVSNTCKCRKWFRNAITATRNCLQPERTTTSLSNANSIMDIDKAHVDESHGMLKNSNDQSLFNKRLSRLHNEESDDISKGNKSKNAHKHYAGGRSISAVIDSSIEYIDTIDPALTTEDKSVIFIDQHKKISTDLLRRKFPTVDSTAMVHNRHRISISSDESDVSEIR